MPITPVRSSIQAAPSARDVTAVLRSIRGQYINLSNDVQSRLIVGTPTRIWEQNLFYDLYTPEPLNLVRDGMGYALGNPNEVRQFNRIFIAPTGISANGLVRSRQPIPSFPGKSSIYVHNFYVDWRNPNPADVGALGHSTAQVGFFYSLGPSNSLSNGFWLELQYYPDGSVVPSLNAAAGSWGLRHVVQQNDWNIDQLQVTADISDNPSRSQIDFSGLIQFVTILDFPSSIEFGFIYDGMYLPAHRQFIDGLSGFSGGGVVQTSTQYAAWGLENGFGATDTPWIYPQGSSVDVVGDFKTSEWNQQIVTSDLATIPNGETWYLALAQIGGPYSCAEIAEATVTILEDVLAKAFICRFSTTGDSGVNTPLFVSNAAAQLTASPYQEIAAAAVSKRHTFRELGSERWMGFSDTLNYTPSAFRGDRYYLCVENTSGAAMNVMGSMTIRHQTGGE